jgi:PAS domain S-box-containing protein
MINIIIVAAAAIIFAILYLCQKNKYSNLLKSITGPINIVNKKGHIVKIVNENYVSESPFKMTNTTNKDLSELFVDETDKDLFIKDLNSVINGTEFKTKKIFDIKTNTGKIRPMIINIMYYNDSSAYVYIDGMPSSENNEAKNQNRINEMFFDYLDIPISVRDYSNRLSFMFWNKKAENLFGVKRESILGNDICNFMDEESAKILEEKAVKLANGSTESIDIDVRINKTSTLAPLTITQSKLSTDKTNWLITCYTDNTQSKKMNSILDLLMQQCHLVTKKSNMTMWIWNIKSKTMHLSSENVNYPNEVLFENSEENIMKSIKSADQPRLATLMENIRNNKISELSIEFEWYKKSLEKYVWVDSHGTIYKRDNDGNPTMMIGVTFNIDSQKRQEENNKKAERIMQQSSNTKSNLLKNINMVINNPLNSILGYSQLLEEENDPLVRKEYVKNLQQDSASLLNKINILLQITNIQSGDATFIKQPVDLNGMITEVHGIAVNQNINENLSFKIDVPKVTTTLMLDNRYLMKVMNNLITNAMRYTFSGTITIGYNIYPDKRVYVFVKDTGCGIPEEKAKTLFDRFNYSADHNNTISGLGLPLCKAIIERLGGEIGVESEVGKGSTFWFTINMGY